MCWHQTFISEKADSIPLRPYILVEETINNFLYLFLGINLTEAGEEDNDRRFQFRGQWGKPPCRDFRQQQGKQGNNSMRTSKGGPPVPANGTNRYRAWCGARLASLQDRMAGPEHGAVFENELGSAGREAYVGLRSPVKAFTMLLIGIVTIRELRQRSEMIRLSLGISCSLRNRLQARKCEWRGLGPMTTATALASWQ